MLLSVYISDFGLPTFPSQFGAVIFVHPSCQKFSLPLPVSLLCPRRSSCPNVVLSSFPSHSGSVNLTLSCHSCCLNLAQSTFSLTQFWFVCFFLSLFSRSTWLPHCCVVTVSLCLTHSCSINHFFSPFLSRSCCLNVCCQLVFHSFWFLSVRSSSFFQFICLNFVPSIFPSHSGSGNPFPHMFSVELVVSTMCYQSFSLIHSLTFCSVNPVFLALSGNIVVTVLCCQFFSLTFVLSFLFSLTHFRSPLLSRSCFVSPFFTYYLATVLCCPFFSHSCHVTPSLPFLSRCFCRTVVR